LTDQKRGQMFSKMARAISVAVKQGGPNPETNSKLHVVFEQAKKFAMPKENIERALKQAAGDIERQKLEEVSFEAYGPGGIALIIEGITDNKNRAIGEIKQILNQNGGKLVGEGGVRWMFEKKGCIVANLKSQTSNLKDKERLGLLAIEVGAQDFYWHDDTLDIYTKIEDLERVKKNLEQKRVEIESASLDWVEKETIEVSQKDKEACQKLFEALDESDCVQEIYSNLKS